MEEKKAENVNLQKTNLFNKLKNGYKHGLMQVDFQDVQRYFLYLLIIVQAIALQTALHDAAFFCTNYCEASELSFSSYTNGDCRCVRNQEGASYLLGNNNSLNISELVKNITIYNISR